SAAAMHYFTKDILIDPNDATQSTWYVAVERGTGAAATLGGVFRTSDRGLAWTQISKLNAESMTIDPNDPATMYVTTDAAGLWRTRNLQAAQPTFVADAAYPFRHPERVF